MGIGVYMPQLKESFSAAVGGIASSTNPESVAILVALEMCPPDANVHVFTDSANCFIGVSNIIRLGDYCSESQVGKHNNWLTWEAIRASIQTKSLNVEIFKVRGHSGDSGNDLADFAASQGSKSGHFVTVHSGPDSRGHYVLGSGEILLFTAPRRFIRNIQELQTQASWISHLCLTRHPEVIVDIHWLTIKAILAYDGKMSGGYTSRNTCHIRTYITKLITRTLPTFRTLARTWREYEAYPCPTCLQEEETFDYMWSCSTSATRIDEAVQKARELVGRILTRDEIIAIFKCDVTGTMVEKINEADLEIQSNIRQKYYGQPLFVDCTPYKEE